MYIRNEDETNKRGCRRTISGLSRIRSSVFGRDVWLSCLSSRGRISGGYFTFYFPLLIPAPTLQS